MKNVLDRQKSAMSLDRTQQQTPHDLQQSQELSLLHTRPPTEVPGIRVERFLGSGAYGEVWVGVDRNTGRRVAIKFYAHKQGVDWSLLSREVEKLVFLSADRYVVQLLEVGWDAEPPFYVMEYLENGSLDDLLRSGGALPTTAAVELFTEICRGLSHAHGKGVLHCDLKPANILLDQDHKPRLADFGQSRLSSEQTPALGTLFFMAPEQADLSSVPDVRWDVYALGAILHCLLTGDPPFRTTETLSLLDTAVDLPDRLARYRHALQTSPGLDDQRLSKLDNPLRELMERCLAIDPQQRFANVQEVLSSLEQRQRAQQMRPMLAFGLVFPLLMLLVMSFFGWRGYHRALFDTESLAERRAIENNQFAAQLAAERVAAEIERDFDIVSDEAARTAFNEYFDAVRTHSLLPQLANPRLEEAALAQLQEEFSSDSKREDLNNYLVRRLRRYKQHPKLASMFVLNAEGTMLAAAYEGDEVSQSVARNFAYRSYFHGGPIDLPKETRITAIRPIQETHLSAVFQSSTTKKWKVAISTPIWRDVPDSEEEQVAGLLVVTLNLGDFDFFKTIQKQGAERLAVLVDGRPGDHTGVILQHPLFDTMLSSNQTLPNGFQKSRVPLQADGTLPQDLYVDPLGQTDFGEAYARSWLAAAAPVRSVNNEGPMGGENGSGLVVLVQEDYLAVISPVRQLGQRLVREGLLALAVVVLVTVLLWYLVLRIVREPPRTPRPIPSVVTRVSTPIHAETTILAQRPAKH
jgi:eukaryotic-like serine/threonine-protein kinase